MKKLKIWLIAGILALVSVNAMAAYTGPLSFHFKAVANSSKTLSCTSANSVQTFVGAGATNAPDVVIRNIGAKVAYYEIGASTAVASATTSQAINPGEADLMSKEQADSVACITAGADTTSLVATPGTGN